MRKNQQQPYQPSGMKAAKVRVQGAGTNTCTVTTTRRLTLGSTDAVGWKILSTTIDPLNGAVVPPVVVGIAGGYEYYRIKSCVAEVVPSGGTLAVGDIMHGFVTSPEIIWNFNRSTTPPVLLTDAQKGDIITNEQGVVTHPLSMGGRKAFSSARVTGRRWYQTNSVVAATVDDADRSFQAMWFALIRGPANSSILAVINFHVTFELTGLASAATATNIASLGTLGYAARLNYTLPEGEEDFPSEVILYNRVGERKFSALKPPVEPA